MKKFYYLGALACGLFLSACSSNSEPDHTTESAKLCIKFVYDYNMLWTNAFQQQVSSVNVWAFDSSGALAWSGASSVSESTAKDFQLNADLKEGKYDLVAWCGLNGNEAIDISSYEPKSKDELEVTIKTVDANGLHVSDQYLSGLFNASLSGVNVVYDSGNASSNIVTLHLIKDTKDISVILQYADGTPVDGSDFWVTITDTNGKYAWDNSILTAPVVTYYPWKRANSTFELSTGRLITGSDARLTVNSRVNNNDIIHIPLINYLLLVKDNYDQNLSEQEYLDRQDNYSLVFTLSNDDNWDMNAGVIINDRVVRLFGEEL